MDLKYKILVGVLLGALVGFAFYSSPESIQKCVDATGWTAARCQIELTR